MPLRTAADAEALATKLSDIITGRYADLPIYSVFLKSFVRQLNLPLVDIQVREVASGLTALANEKQKAQKEAAGGKKKSKAATKPVLGASKGLAAGRVDTRSYEDALDDSGEFDDFVCLRIFLLSLCQLTMESDVKRVRAVDRDFSAENEVEPMTSSSLKFHN